MHNVILMTFLISLIWNFFAGKKPTGNLNCGIFAWTGPSSDKFNPIIFNVIGAWNDSRGGDSAGVYFNRGVITGIGTNARYEALTKSQKLMTTVRPGKYPIVIGHCRKASVGAVVSQNIQPVLVRNEKERLTYVQAHNGTITNHKELATKYGVKVLDGESDSVVMSKVIDKAGFKVLSEYEGSAALVMHFTKEPTALYAFHGMSKSYQTVTEERPLHYITIDGGGTYISSEPNPLEFLFNGESATSFKYNVLYKMIGDEVIEVEKIDREKSVLRKYSEPAKSVNNSHNHHCGQSSRGYYNVYDPYDELPFNIRGEHTVYTNTGNSNMNRSGVTKNIACSLMFSSLSGPTDDTRLRFSKGYFYHGKILAHGYLISDVWGYVRNIKMYPTASIKTYHLYFCYGILLVDSDSYEDVLVELKRLKITDSEMFYDMANFNKMSDIFFHNSVFPYTRRSPGAGSGYMEPTANFLNDKAFVNETFFCGSFVPLFYDNKLYFSEGDLIGYEKETGGVSTIADFLEENPYFAEIGFGTEEESDKSGIAGVKSCTECVTNGYYKKGKECNSCTRTFLEKVGSLKDEQTKADEDDAKVTLLHTIAVQAAPICDDMEQPLGELEQSGFKHTVKDEYNILVDANNKLKELNV